MRDDCGSDTMLASSWDRKCPKSYVEIKTNIFNCCGTLIYTKKFSSEEDLFGNIWMQLVMMEAVRLWFRWIKESSSFNLFWLVIKHYCCFLRKSCFSWETWGCTFNWTELLNINAEIDLPCCWIIGIYMIFSFLSLLWPGQNKMLHFPSSSMDKTMTCTTSQPNDAYRGNHFLYLLVLNINFCTFSLLGSS